MVSYLSELFRSLGIEFIELPRDRSGLLSVDKFLANLSNELKVKSFEELDIPLMVVASDFWHREPVIFREGPLLDAIHASMALPGIFSPVVQDSRVLIDGGAVNPLPFDLLFDDCDIVVAVNVMGQRSHKPDAVPSISEAIFNTFQIMQRAILNEKLKQRGPDILVEPQITGIKVLEFFKAEEIFRQAASAKQDLKRDLKKLLVD